MTVNIPVTQCIDGWVTCEFTSFSTVFRSYQDDERLIMKGCVQWSPVYGWVEFPSSGARTRDYYYLETTNATGNHKRYWNQKEIIGSKYLSENNLQGISLIRGKLFSDRYLQTIPAYWFQLGLLLSVTLVFSGYPVLPEVGVDKIWYDIPTCLTATGCHIGDSSLLFFLFALATVPIN